MTDSHADTLSRQPLPTALFIKWLAVGLFCTLSLLPIFQAALISTGTDTAAGRFGLIMPVLLLADDTSLGLLAQMFIATGLNLIFVTLWGLIVGLTAAGTRSRLVRGLFQMAFWPATFPVWLGPLVILSLGHPALFALNDWQKLLLWIFWVGWWGSMRLAAEIQSRVQQIDPQRFEACEVLGGGPWQAFRMVIRPVIQNNLRQTLLLTTAMLIFDPSPMLLAGVLHWPSSMVVSEVLQPSGPGLYLAATWLLLMGLIMGFFSVLIRWLAGQKSVDSTEIQARDTGKTSKRYSLFSRATPMALLAIWPWLLLIAFGRSHLAEMQSAILNWNPGEVSTVFHLLLSVSALLATCIFASFLLHNWSIHEGLAEAGQSLVVFQPMLVTALGLKLVWAWTLAWKLPIDLAGNAFFWQLITIFCVMIMAMGTIARQHKTKATSRVNQEMQKAKFEAAITLGATPARARKLAGISGQSARSSTAQVAALFEQAWWLATAPAWALVAPLLIGNDFPMALTGRAAGELSQSQPIQSLVLILLTGLAARFIAKFT